MPNSRLTNQKVNVGVRGSVPNVRVSNFQTSILTHETTTSTAVTMGTPIGLLLALTYAADFTSAVTTPPIFVGDSRPNTRIN